MANECNTKAALRYKTAIAKQLYIIQARAERYLSETHNYVTRRIPDGQFEHGRGERPRKVRYSTAPVPDYAYTDLLVEGEHNGTMRTRGEDGKAVEMAVSGINNRGAAGCHLPGQTIHAGFDEFGRIVKGKAWETEPVCALDLILKDRWNDYLDMIQRDFPRRAKEQFEYELERLVVEYGRYNSSIVQGFTHSEGAFPAPPMGTLDLGSIRRLAQIAKNQGWQGMFEFGPISPEAFETMKRNYKTDENLELTSTVESGETRFLSPEVQVVEWAGIRWIIDTQPLRGVLVRGTNGGWEFQAIRPVVGRPGTGGGVVSDVNEDYFKCRTMINGVQHEIYEVGFFIDPMAAQYNGFAMPNVGPKTFDRDKFNFQLDMIDGAFLECNEDNFKWKLRMLHAFEFESTNPELMGAVIYRVQPDIINIHAPICDTCVDDDPVDMQQPCPPDHDECSLCETDDTVEEFPIMDPQPTIDNPDPDNTAGVFRLANGGPYVTDQGETVKLYVERKGGFEGQVSVQVDTSDGTATDGDDFTGVSGLVLTWADGENHRKVVEIPIAADADTGTDFTVALSNATGGAQLASTDVGATNATIEIEDLCV